MAKIKGKVKWFSNRKGFGFIDPVSDNSPTKEPIFVHQTVIQSDGEYRTLIEGADVEFDVETEESGKLKAVNVTGPNGASLKPPAKKDRRKRLPRGKKDGGGTTSGESGDEGEKTNGRRNKKDDAATPAKTDKPPREPPFHDVIEEDAKKKIEGKGIELGKKVTIDLALGSARIKLGQGGYAGLADASGMVGEGTYACDAKALITFTWEKCIVYKDGKWTSSGLDKLMKSFSMANDDIKPVGAEETAETLWGSDKVDPKDALAENEFKMKRIVLTRPPNTGRNKRRVPPRKYNNRKKE